MYQKNTESACSQGIYEFTMFNIKILELQERTYCDGNSK